MRKKMTARVAVAVLLLVLAFVAPLRAWPTASAADPVSLVINGKTVATDVPPVIIDGRTLVPLRVISENLGAQVDWNQGSRTAFITMGATRVALKVGDSQATVNGDTVYLDVAARIISDRTMVPVRFVSQSLGAAVAWDQANRRVTVDLAVSQPALEGLSWQETPGVARFVIATNGRVHYSTSVREPEELYPNDRLLVEVDNADCDLPDATAVGVAGVERIRAYKMETAPMSRVIFDLDEPVRYTVWATWEPNCPVGLEDLPYDFSPGQQAIVVDVQYKVLGVEFVDDPGAERLVVHLNGPADYRVWEASNPWRLVIDARRATLAKSLEGQSNAERTRAIGEFGVTQARFAQFTVDPDTARIVLDAAGPTAYNVVRDGNDIVVYLGGTLSITGFGYERLDTGGRLTVWAGRPLRPTVTRATNPDRVILKFEGALLSGNLSGGGSVRYGDDLVLDIGYSEDTAAQTTTFTVYPRGTTGAEVTTTADGVTVDIGRSALTGKKIVLDPGHGGTDPGAIAPNGLHEADLTLPIALKLADLLRNAGAEVTMTRTTAAGNPDKYARPELANAIGADVCVAIHLNANNNSSICGTETYFYHDDSRLLAELVLSRLLDELGRPDGGVRWADFVATREAKMPSCLVEGLYMTNPTDLALLMQPGTLDRIAGAIFKGLEDYFAHN